MKKTLKTILILVVFIIGCFGSGLLVGDILKHIFGKSVSNIGSDNTVIMISSIVSLFVSFILTIIIHEAGHLVCGLITGYKYLLFRVGSLSLIKRNNKFEFKKFSIQGTGGQCILMPPDSDDPKNVPCFLYHLGGGLFNFITALIAFPIAFATNSHILRPFFLVLGMLSLFQAFMNLIPRKGQIPNDGYNILMMLRNPAERVAMYKTLKVNGLLFKGSTPSQIPPELYDLGAEGFYDVVETILKGAERIDSLDFKNAEKLFSESADNNTIKYYQLEGRSELMFCKIMNGAPSEEIDKVYDTELANFITAAGKTLISKRRQMYAYQLLYKHDEEAAEKEYQAAMKLKDTYPIEGEVTAELKLIDFIRSRKEAALQS